MDFVCDMDALFKITHEPACVSFGFSPNQRFTPAAQRCVRMPPAVIRRSLWRFPSSRLRATFSQSLSAAKI